MSPAMIRRTEHPDTGEGWGSCQRSYGITLDCSEMPTPDGDGALSYDDVTPDMYFGWTGESYERWVTEQDRVKLAMAGYALRYYLCPPGTFVIGYEQAIFRRHEAIAVSDEP